MQRLNVFTPQPLNADQIEKRIRDSFYFLFQLDVHGNEIIVKREKNKKVSINGEKFPILKNIMYITSNLGHTINIPDRNTVISQLVDILGQPSNLKAQSGYGKDRFFVARYDFDPGNGELLERTYVEYSGDDSR